MTAMRRSRPDRKSFNGRIYREFVIAWKLLGWRKLARRAVCEKYGIPKRHVNRMYDKYIRPQLRAGVKPRELW